MATTLVSRSEFLSRLRSSGLLTAAQWRDLETQLPDTERGRLIARALVERGLLTRFQAERLLAGRIDGFRLGRYVILDEIGRGGMGKVYLARHTGLNKTVALKLLATRLTRTARARSMFLREVQATSQLSHPHLVAALDAGSIGDRLFLVMEFVDGPNLADLVSERGPLSVGLACDLVRQAAQGLQHAHEHGLIHRDIKPHNVLVHAGNNGRATAKILDFGLARLGVPEGGSGWTQLSSLDQVPANTVLGTPDFVAPEQARDLARADIRADIYSLGATLHYLLTGQVPFPGGSVIEKLLRHNTEEPTPLDHIRTDVPTELAQVVRRMMAKRPDDRYATPCEVARALAPWCEGNRASWETVGPLVPPPLEQETPWGDLWSDTPAPHGELTLTFDDPVAPQRRGLGLALFGVAMFAAGAAAGWFWLG